MPRALPDISLAHEAADRYSKPDATLKSVGADMGRCARWVAAQLRRVRYPIRPRQKRTIPPTLRAHILALKHGHQTATAVAKSLGLARTTVSRIWNASVPYRHK